MEFKTMGFYQIQREEIVDIKILLKSRQLSWRIPKFRDQRKKEKSENKA